jgi:hypothetical protein
VGGCSEGFPPHLGMGVRKKIEPGPRRAPRASRDTDDVAGVSLLCSAGAGPGGSAHISHAESCSCGRGG